MVLVMTVVPGKGGQKLIPETLEKVKELKKYIDENNIDIDKEIVRRENKSINEIFQVYGENYFRNIEEKMYEEYAKKQIIRQMDQVKRLGINADFEDRYVTLHKSFEKNQIHVFSKMALDGLIYKGKKPVYWSYSSESALAEAEVEYHDVKSPTIFVKFPVKDGKGLLDNDTYFVIWTTTPWTIPSNEAVCLNPDLVYAEVQTEQGKLIFLESMTEQLLQRFHLRKRRNRKPDQLCSCCSKPAALCCRCFNVRRMCITHCLDDNRGFTTYYKVISDLYCFRFHIPSPLLTS